MFAVALKRCESYERSRVLDAVASAVDLLGGMSKFVRPGARVLVKPNLLYPRPAEAAVTTHPEVVRAVVELAQRAGASEVLVGDSPALARAASVAKVSGLSAALAGTPARLVDFDATVEVKGELYPRLVLAKRVVESDVVINVAKAKTHAHTGLTLATKNCFGCVPGLRKSQWHLRAGSDEQFGRLIIDVARTVRPALSIVDAVVAMEGNGPGNGTPRPIGALAAGVDTLAVDAVLSRLLGFRREELTIETAAVATGGAPRRAKDIEIVGDPVADFAVKDFRRAAGRNVDFAPLFRLPEFVVRLGRRFATPQPVISDRLCRRCGQCAKICPPKAMDFRKGELPVIDRDTCIRCFCCQEICPHGAITVREGALARIFSR